jgi:hypothetical protein
MAQAPTPIGVIFKSELPKLRVCIIFLADDFRLTGATCASARDLWTGILAKRIAEMKKTPQGSSLMTNSLMVV